MGRGGHCPLVDRARAAGEWIFLEGERASLVWFIKRGTVTLSRSVGEDGGDQGATALRREGSFLGLEALVRPTYADTARALTDVKLCGAPADAFDEWLGPKGTPARVALQQTLQAAASDAPRGASADGTAVCRVARWLLDQPEQAGAPDVPRGVTASLLGMVPETFSRALARLAAKGAIEVTRRAVRVRDRQALIDAAERRKSS